MAVIAMDNCNIFYTLNIVLGYIIYRILIMFINIPDTSQLPNNIFNFITKEKRWSIIYSDKTYFKINNLYKKDNNWIQ